MFTLYNSIDLENKKMMKSPFFITKQLTVNMLIKYSYAIDLIAGAGLT